MKVGHLCWLLLCLGTAGCFSSLISTDGIACGVQGDCPGTMSCSPLLHRCVQGAEPNCSRHQDCPLGQICAEGACVEGCLETGDCGLDRDCVDGRCQPPGTCTTDAICPIGTRCAAATGRCEVTAETSQLCERCEANLCLTDADCGPGVICDRPDLDLYGECQDCGAGGDCFARSGETVCTTDAQCPAGTWCLGIECALGGDRCGAAGLGACEVQGPPDPPAAEGLGRCALGVCGTRSCASKGCAPLGGELPGYPCPRGYECTDIVARPNTGACTQDSQCSSGQCRRLNEASDLMLCACAGDADCPTGSTCQNGGCLQYRACLPSVGLSCGDLQ